MTPNEKLYAIANSLLSDGDLEITIDGSEVTSVELVEQRLDLVCENDKHYPAEMVNLAEMLTTAAHS